MKITKGEHKNTLTYNRKDGTLISMNLGFDISNHKIGHYIVEKEFKL